jgi:hypothetical protein
MGKSGLTKLLVGSVESRVRDDRSRSFGALEHLQKARIDELIERMVEDGLLEKVYQQGASRDFNALRVGALGATATDEMLESYATPVRARSTGRATEPVGGSIEDDELDPEDVPLYERLAAWRRGQASEQGVSAFIVA